MGNVRTTRERKISDGQAHDFLRVQRAGGVASSPFPLLII